MNALLLLSLLAADSEWKQVDVVDGITIESRPVEGSKVVELRLTQKVKANPRRMCDEAFGTGKFDPDEQDLTSRKILSESADERVTYDTISPAVVSNRDYAVRAKREPHEDGSCTMSFEAANDVAPKLPDGYVRVARLKGYWRFTPIDGETSTLVYDVHSDPGGAIPAFMIEGPRRKLAVKWVKMIVARAQKPAAQGK